MPARLQIRLTESEDQELVKLSHNANLPERTRKRAEVLRLNAQGWTVNQIASWMDWAPNTVRRAIQRWILKGVEGLRDARIFENVLAIAFLLCHEWEGVSLTRSENMADNEANLSEANPSRAILRDAKLTGGNHARGIVYG